MRHLIPLLLLLLSFSSSKAVNLTRKIIDSQTHEAIVGVYVSRTDTNITTISDDRGLFTISIPDKDSVYLQFSCLGYEKRLVAFAAKEKNKIVALKPSSNELDEVQVFGNRSPINFNSQFSMTTISSSEIQENISSSLIDVLQTVPGMYKKAEYNSPLVLRGLSGKRLLVTKDGNRRMGNFADGFMGQTVNVYDLQRVDVIKGPASVKYGPGAIAGIINMVSKSPFANEGIHGRLLSSYGFNNQEKNLLGGLSWSNTTQAITVSGRYRKAEYFIYANGKTADNSAYADKDLSGTYAWRKNNQFSLVLETDLHFGGPWGRPRGFNGTQYLLLSNLQDNSFHFSATAKWQPEEVAENVELSLYYDKEKRDQLRKDYDIGTGKLSYTEEIKYDNYYGGWRLQSDFRFFVKTKLSVGTDGVYYRISSPNILTDYFQHFVINNRVANDAGVVMGCVFAESETKVNNKLRWIIGLRSDLANINEGSVHDTLLAAGRTRKVFAYNGTTGIVYEAWKDKFFSFNAARACRMPDATEMFIETSNTDGLVFGNPSLKPEYGLNFDAGFRGKVGFMSFDLSAFSNYLHNFISSELWLNSGKKGINYRYENIDRSRIEGLEFSTQLRFNKVFCRKDELIYSGFVVYTEGHDLRNTSSWFSEGEALGEIPPLNSHQELTYRYKLTKNWQIYGGIDWIYFAKQDKIPANGYVSESYKIWGCSGGIEAKIKTYKIKCSMNTYNMTNVKYKAFESLIPSMGRNVKLLLSVNW